MRNSIILLIAAFFITNSINAQKVNAPEKVMESFENGIPATLTARGGKLSIDTQRFKHGKQALKWDWVGNDALIFNTPIGYHKQRNVNDINPVGRDKYIVESTSRESFERPRGFFMWIYNESTSTQRLTFQFGRDNLVDCEFDYYLDFKGWRTVYIIYDRGDMRGTPHPDMNRMTILAPEIGKGSYYIDAIGLSLPMNPRNNAPNMQLPFIDPHPRIVTQYAQRLLEHHAYKPSFPIEPLTPDMEKELNELNAKVDEFILPSYDRERFAEKGIDDIRKDFASYNIQRIGDEIYGKPLIKAGIYTEYFVETGLGKKMLENVKGWRYDYGSTLYNIASRYRSIKNDAEKLELEQMFIDLFDYGVDQGFAVGAGLGWLHHYSYTIRQHGAALYLMREVLEKHDLLEEAVDVLKWFAAFGQVYREDVVYGCKGRKSADADDTQGLLKPRLYSALMMKNSPEKVRDLKHLSSFFSNVTTAYANGLDECFKPDGTCFHHAGHSMGYGGRAINGALSVLYMLSNSPFKATTQAWQRMKKINESYFHLLFTNELKTPRTFPSIRFVNFTHPQHFMYFPALLALSSDAFDTELAGMYKQLIETKDELNDLDNYWLRKLEEKGTIGIYNYPKTRILTYSRISTHRDQNNWIFSVRGHSKYVYPYESWEAKRFSYPCFISYGYHEVSYPDNLDSTQPVGEAPKEKGSNTWQDGYDWHRWPGTTTVHVPYEQIITSPVEVKDEGGEYPFSDQAFVGGVSSQDGNGIYVFPFKGHDKFGLQSFTGKKSYFLFDDMIVCLGTNINSKIEKYPVETTIIQNMIESDKDQLLTNNGIIDGLDYNNVQNKIKPTWLIDSRGTGYYLPELSKNTSLLIQRKKQTNPDFQSLKEVSGNFTTVLLNHGIAPKNASYNYAILIGADQQKMVAFTNEMKGRNKPYEIIQKDEKAHIVRSDKSSTTSYAVFNESVQLKRGIVKAVNRPATFVVKEENNAIKLAVADPDLNIYDGQDDLMPDGTRVEKAVYMHEWYYWPSRSSKVQITLNGKWNIAKQIKKMETAKEKRANILSSNDKQTVIEFECRDGLSAEVLLIK